MVAFNGDAARSLAAQFLALAEKQGATTPLMIGHRIMGTSLLETGDIAEGRAHYDQALALYDPAEHRPLATRFGQDIRVAVLSFRALALLTLGFTETALADTDRALEHARDIRQAASLMQALGCSSSIHFLHGNYAAANTEADELVALAVEKGAFYWKAFGMATQGCVMALTGKASNAVQMLTSGMTAFRSTGATAYIPVWLSYLATAYGPQQ
jgi:tetratricopeptide (TPR) repeat protein